jgi:hypothetical protein
MVQTSVDVISLSSAAERDEEDAACAAHRIPAAAAHRAAAEPATAMPMAAVAVAVDAEEPECPIYKYSMFYVRGWGCGAACLLLVGMNERTVHDECLTVCKGYNWYWGKLGLPAKCQLGR